MENKDHSWKYEIILKVGAHEFNDIIYFVVYKLPSLYISSFARLCIMLPPTLIYSIIEQIGLSKYPHVTLEIYSPDDITGERVNLIFSKTYRIINIIGNVRVDTPKQFVILQLSNTILYRMATTFSFDKLLKNLNGKELLDSYHEFLKNTYGDNFKINYICDQNDFFDFKYEETLINSKNDLMIPYNIIHQRNPSKFYPIYFFDDFYFDDKENKNINIFYIDYSNINHHNQSKTIYEYIENIFNIQSEKSIPFGDYSKSLDKFNENTSKTYIDLENMIAIPKRKQTGKTFQFDQISDKIKITNKKELFNIESHLTGESSLEQSNFEMLISFSDTHEFSNERIQKCYDLFKKGPNNIRYVRTRHGLIDWVQLGFKYCLDVDFPNNFNVAPFNIINIFKREIKHLPDTNTNISIEPVWCKYFCQCAFFDYTIEEEP